ncbi:hypothetical protein QBC35DRAFT_383047 [Podospora australis]|uniref:Uncharacterized protein n=1 Tax=Podospora australis TaxID=1536484 RepID=A0AAN7AJG1_9PEZI|nr:hypothetical protein QBC35DRAFT_383047 [Podospora australis]
MALTRMPREILGPLTTVWVPPASCTVAIGQCEGCDVAWLGQTCDPSTVKDNASCWPPTTEGAKPTQSAFYGWGFYSPGLECPSGHTSACSATHNGVSGWKVQFEMEAQETFVGCCPTGYKCNNLNGQTCLAATTATIIPTVSCEDGLSNRFGMSTIPNSRMKDPAVNLFAPMIQLAWKPSDLSGRLSSATASTASSTSSSTSLITTTRFDLAEETDVSGAGSGSGGISTGAIAGIAVGAAAVLIAVLAGAFFLWKYKRRGDAASAEYSPADQASPPPVYATTTEYKSNYSGQPGAGANGQAWVPVSGYPQQQVFELGPGGPVELDGSRWKTVYEAPGPGEAPRELMDNSRHGDRVLGVQVNVKLEGGQGGITVEQKPMTVKHKP